LGAVLVVAIGVALVFRCDLAGRHADARLDRGVALLARAIDGDAAAFDEAERTLAGAATLTDPYPLTVLEVARRLRERRWDDASDGVRDVLAQLSAARYDDALATAAALPPADASRDLLVRLVGDLRAAHLARSAESE
jgi:hypothetical protein